jgi:SAM-dependent methyltransferase
MFYFDPKDQRVLFGDIRNESHVLCDGRALNVHPDMPMDFRQLPFADEVFQLVVFDPPHLIHAGNKSWLRLKYGALAKTTWKQDITDGFRECFRVLKPNGIFIFKWNEIQIPVREVLACTDQKPLFGHPSGKRGRTHWMTFMKEQP